MKKKNTAYLFAFLKIDEDLLKKYEVFINFFKDYININNTKVKIIKLDFLKYNFGKKNKKFKIFGNIPYNISSSIIKKIAKNSSYLQYAILTTQKEYFERLNSIPGEKNAEISFLTVFVNYHFKIEKLMDIKKSSFYPVPEVNSTVFCLKPDNKFGKIFPRMSSFNSKDYYLKVPLVVFVLKSNYNIIFENNVELKKDKDRKEKTFKEVFSEIDIFKLIVEDEFFKFVSFCFSNKRKKLLNSVKQYIINNYNCFNYFFNYSNEGSNEFNKNCDDLLYMHNKFNDISEEKGVKKNQINKNMQIKQKIKNKLQSGKRLQIQKKIEDIFYKLNLNINIRAENLNLEKWGRLFESIIIN